MASCIASSLTSSGDRLESGPIKSDKDDHWSYRIDSTQYNTSSSIQQLTLVGPVVSSYGRGLRNVIDFLTIGTRQSTQADVTGTAVFIKAPIMRLMFEEWVPSTSEEVIESKRKELIDRIIQLCIQKQRQRNE